jgi:hypothetical protein
LTRHSGWEYARDFFLTETERHEENANLYYTEDGTKTIELEEVGTTDGLIERLLID